MFGNCAIGMPGIEMSPASSTTADSTPAKMGLVMKNLVNMIRHRDQARAGPCNGSSPRSSCRPVCRPAAHRLHRREVRLLVSLAPACQAAASQRD